MGHEGKFIHFSFLSRQDIFQTYKKLNDTIILLFQEFAQEYWQAHFTPWLYLGISIIADVQGVKTPLPLPHWPDLRQYLIPTHDDKNSDQVTK